MDLAVGARQVWVLMEHQTKSGMSRLVRRCTYPLTAVGVVKRVYTNLAVLDVTAAGFVVRDKVDGLTLEALQKNDRGAAARVGKIEKRHDHARLILDRPR